VKQNICEHEIEKIIVTRLYFLELYYLCTSNVKLNIVVLSPELYGKSVLILCMEVWLVLQLHILLFPFKILCGVYWIFNLNM
jgi:hypothetical protein